MSKCVYCSLVVCVHCTLGVAQIFVFFTGGVTGSLYIKEHCCKVSAKNNDRYPPANVILGPHLNNSTSKLCSNTWLSPTRFLKLNDCFKLFFCKSKKFFRYIDFSILLQNTLLNNTIINIDITINVLS